MFDDPSDMMLTFVFGGILGRDPGRRGCYWHGDIFLRLRGVFHSW